LVPKVDVSMKVHFLTFGGGGQTYRDAVKRISGQAYRSGWFDAIYPVTDDEIFNINNDWTERNRDFIFRNKRGYGYWIWKPFLIMELMRRINYGDLLVYADAGAELNVNGSRRFYELQELASQNDVVVFELEHKATSWTKGDLFLHLGVSLDDPVAAEKQLMGTAIFLRKTTATLQIISHWALLCEACNYGLLDDSISVSPNDAKFNEHRHDQSIFSLLVRLSGCSTILPDETYFPDVWHKNGYHPSAPIQALRNKTGAAKIPF